MNKSMADQFSNEIASKNVDANEDSHKFAMNVYIS